MYSDLLPAGAGLSIYKKGLLFAALGITLLLQWSRVVFMETMRDKDTWS